MNGERSEAGTTTADPLNSLNNHLVVVNVFPAPASKSIIALKSIHILLLISNYCLRIRGRSLKISSIYIIICLLYYDSFL